MTDTNLHPLLAISPLDGRYHGKTEELRESVSEFGLLRFRVQVECEWFLTLAATKAIVQLPALDDASVDAVRSVYKKFDLSDAEEIRAIERQTNHDVKAVEYFVKDRFAAIDATKAHVEFVHFACTSEDINNLAYALMLKDTRARVLLPAQQSVIQAIDALAGDSADTAMLSRTHGQAASPTTMGKELANFAARLTAQRHALANVKLLGKCNGAVGNYNAHRVAYPDVDWPAIAAAFIGTLGLELNPYTTQIEPHDYMAEYFHAVARFNQILLDFDRDVWSYISIGYFGQRRVEGETGSSTMPHKVNPIDFENSEGNLGVANAVLEHLAAKLQVSRWQRDLSDSTVLRNIGAACGHALIAYKATLAGMTKLTINDVRMAEDLNDAWEVLAEPVQTVMRKYGMPEPYEQLKAATRGRQFDAALFAEVLETLNLPDAAMAELAHLTPEAYIGLAAVLARRVKE